MSIKSEAFILSMISIGFPHLMYPLVICYIATENGHL